MSCCRPKSCRFGGEWSGTLYPVISACIVAWVAVATSVALHARRVARFGHVRWQGEAAGSRVGLATLMDMALAD